MPKTRERGKEHGEQYDETVFSVTVTLSYINLKLPFRD